MTPAFAHGPAHGQVDAAGRLVAADPALAGLHARAGGVEGGAVAVPQIAAVARLARRLGIVISRGVIAADGPVDLDLWVRAAPEGEGVRLAVTGWTERAAAAPHPASAAERERDFQRASGAWGWEVDPALRLASIAPALAAAVGRPATEIVGEALPRLFTLIAEEDGTMPLLEALALQRAFGRQRAELRGDRVLALLLSGAPRMAADGAFAGFRGIAVEAPPPVVGAAEADAFGRRLDSALRAPLDRIIARADTIRAQEEGPLRRGYADYAADIASAGRHLLGLVDDLVDLQAIERADFRLELQPIDLADVARRAAGLLGVRAADKGVRIDRPATDETLPALGDFRRALQVVVNLVGNAVRYSPPGGAVWLRCERDGDKATLCVADQGKGIAPEDQARIFDKFERVDPSEPGGTGLGLYIARRLARAMGGDIVVDSAPGQGARFVLGLRGDEVRP